MAFPLVNNDGITPNWGRAVKKAIRGRDDPDGKDRKEGDGVQKGQEILFCQRESPISAIARDTYEDEYDNRTCFSKQSSPNRKVTDDGEYVSIRHQTKYECEDADADEHC
jgi:hypothetical protein